MSVFYESYVQHWWWTDKAPEYSVEVFGTTFRDFIEGIINLGETPCTCSLKNVFIDHLKTPEDAQVIVDNFDWFEKKVFVYLDWPGQLFRSSSIPIEVLATLMKGGYNGRGIIITNLAEALDAGHAERSEELASLLTYEEFQEAVSYRDSPYPSEIAERLDRRLRLRRQRH